MTQSRKRKNHLQTPTSKIKKTPSTPSSSASKNTAMIQQIQDELEERYVWQKCIQAWSDDDEVLGLPKL